MPEFGLVSESRLITCHPDLQRLMREVVKVYDIMVVCGHRGKKEQNEAFDKGFSKLKWPNSQHNRTPSIAVDIAPWPLDWLNKYRFFHMAGIVLGIASQAGIPVTWGGNWTSFPDMPHFQLHNEV